MGNQPGFLKTPAAGGQNAANKTRQEDQAADRQRLRGTMPLGILICECPLSASRA